MMLTPHSSLFTTHFFLFTVVLNSPNHPNPSPPEFQNYYIEEDAISLSDIMLTMARQIKIIIITPAIFCTLTIIYVLFFSQPIYTSTAKIMSSSSGTGMSQAAGLACPIH